MENTILSYALNAEKRMVHIDTVKNGLECGCVCPSCKEPLVAKNDGKIREHHFAHANGADCGTGYQTMIHLLAKDIIEELKIFPLFLNGKYLSACEIHKEVSLVKEFGIIPDILGFTPVTDGPNIIGKIPVIVEIYVTHKVDDEKAAIIKRQGIPAVEVDLSNVEFTTREALINEIYNPKNWKLINGNIGRQYLPRVTIPITGLVNAYRSLGSHTTPRYSLYSKRGYYRRRR